MAPKDGSMQLQHGAFQHQFCMKTHENKGYSRFRNSETPKLKTESNALCINCTMTKLANKSQKRWDYRSFNAKIVID